MGWKRMLEKVVGGVGYGLRRTAMPDGTLPRTSAGAISLERWKMDFGRLPATRIGNPFAFLRKTTRTTAPPLPLSRIQNLHRPPLRHHSKTPPYSPSSTTSFVPPSHVGPGHRVASRFPHPLPSTLLLIIPSHRRQSRISTSPPTLLLSHTTHSLSLLPLLPVPPPPNGPALDPLHPTTPTRLQSTLHRTTSRMTTLLIR